MYLTIKQACAQLQVSRNTLLGMIEDGRVQAIDRRKPGGKYAKWLIHPHSLTSLADARYENFKKRAGL